jgi:hypothetical protein
MIQKLKKQFRNAGIFTGTSGDRLRDRIFTGHISIGPVTIYGANAMHYAVNIRTDVGHLCARPTTGRGYWKWYVYLSPDATPGRAYWGFGPGFRE